MAKKKPDPDKPEEKAETTRYRKVEPRVWNDEKFVSLSRSNPSGQMLWLYLLTCPYTTQVPGLFVAGLGAMSDDLGWDREPLRERFKELFRVGLAYYDEMVKVVYLPNAIKMNLPANPNIVKSWWSSWSEIPNCELKDKAFANILKHLRERGEAFAEPFAKWLPKPLPKPTRNQEQEQEQEKEQEHDLKQVSSSTETRTSALSAERCELTFDLEPPSWLDDCPAPTEEYPDPVSEQELASYYQPLQDALTEEEHTAIESLSAGEQQPNVARISHDLPLPLNEPPLTATLPLVKKKIAPRANADVLAVWAVYAKYHPLSRQSDATDRIIKARLREGFSADELKRAIEAAHRDEWHTELPGRLALSYVLRNSDKVTRFLEMAAAPQQETLADFHAKLDAMKQEAIAAREGER